MFTPKSKKALAALVPQFSKAHVCIIGDIMLDEYLIGDASRISPEAPVPVVQVEEERLLLGGAGNVARNICALGASLHLIAVTGTGIKAQMLEKMLDELQIKRTLIAIEGRPTSLKTRVLARGQQIVRIDKENASPVLGEPLNRIIQAFEAEIKQAEAKNTGVVLVISDYDKGIVTETFMQRIEAVAAKAKYKPLILVDPKTSNFPLYKNVTLLTPNTKETSEGANHPARNPQEIKECAQRIFESLHCSSLLTTLGADGMALFFSPEQAIHIPSTAQKVFDVTGAGDTVMAVVALGLAAGFSLLDACMIANHAAGVVVAAVGAATVTQAELQQAILNDAELPVTTW